MCDPARPSYQKTNAIMQDPGLHRFPPAEQTKTEAGGEEAIGVGVARRAPPAAEVACRGCGTGGRLGDQVIAPWHSANLLPANLLHPSLWTLVGGDFMFLHKAHRFPSFDKHDPCLD